MCWPIETVSALVVSIEKSAGSLRSMFEVKSLSNVVIALKVRQSAA